MLWNSIRLIIITQGFKGNSILTDWMKGDMESFTQAINVRIINQFICNLFIFDYFTKNQYIKDAFVSKHVRTSSEIDYRY